jgi:glycosyltransferase involved in cell wall biosynthesis
MSLKPLLLAKRWVHHTPSGGYDRIKDEISSAVIHRRESGYFFSGSLRRKVLKHCMPSTFYMNRYHLNDLSAEIRSFIAVYRQHADLLHALYGEDQLNFLLRYRNWLNCALVATYHLPSESTFINKITQAKIHNRLPPPDSAIVMSNSMISDYEQWVGKGNVFFIPHGIDTEIFFPLKNEYEIKDEYLRILIVGGHGRDWNTIKNVVQSSQKNKSIRYKVVGPARVRRMFNEDKNVEVHVGIPETDLIEYYRISDLVLLPVTYATANNALLEALACGTPVISTKTGGIPDYLDHTCGWLLPKSDPRAIIELIESLNLHRNLVLEKTDKARKKSLQYDWKIVAEQTKEVYQITYNLWKKNQS